MGKGRWKRPYFSGSEKINSKFSRFDKWGQHFIVKIFFFFFFLKIFFFIVSWMTLILWNFTEYMQIVVQVKKIFFFFWNCQKKIFSRDPIFNDWIYAIWIFGWFCSKKKQWIFLCRFTLHVRKKKIKKNCDLFLGPFILLLD